MMVGEAPHSDPTVHVPHCLPLDDPTAAMLLHLSFSDVSPVGVDFPDQASPRTTPPALQLFLPSGEACDIPVDAFSSDEFRMFEFKVRGCARPRSHDWTDCPFAHPGEKARRRDPRRYHYSGAACPDFRRGSCERGDACEYAHGVFECWLHPARYRTQACKDGTGCRRRICFFAHTPEQLRVLPQGRSVGSPTAALREFHDGSPRRQAIEASCGKPLPLLSPLTTSSPASISPLLTPASEFAPITPSPGSASFNDVVASVRSQHLRTMKSVPADAAPAGARVRARLGSYSLPTTPTQTPPLPELGLGLRDFPPASFWEEPAMERVESGRGLRARMFEKLSKEKSLLYD